VGSTPLSSGVRQQMNPQATVVLILGSVVLAYSVPIALTWVGHGPGFLRGLGFLAGPKGNGRAWGLAMVVAAAYILLSITTVPGVSRHIADLSWTKGVALCAALAAGVFEEGLFRRFVMDGLLRAGRGTVVQIVVSGLAFGVAHATWGLLGGHMQVAIGAATATTLLGLALACVYVIGGRSLAPCIVAHFAIDAVIEPGLALSALSGFRT